MSHIQVVYETTYTCVAFQTSFEVATTSGGIDVEMGGMGGGFCEPSPVPVVPTVLIVLSHRVVRCASSFHLWY